MKITKKTTLAKILKLPGAEKILAKHKIPCLTCPMAKFEMKNLTLDQICQMYDIDSKKLLKDLSKLWTQKNSAPSAKKSRKNS